MTTPTLLELLDLNTYAKAYPPQEPFTPKGAPAVLYIHPGERWVLQREQTRDIGYGLCREGQLGRKGVSGALHDSQAFADNLYETLEPQLSLCMLRDLAEVFAQALATEEARRTRCLEAIAAA